MNKKAITAIENKKLLKNIKKNNNIKFIYKNIQYREAIIEILKKEKDIGIIFISEDIPGEISIEELINEIKLINKKIEIIFFLNKKNKNKEEKLKKIKVNKNISFYFNVVQIPKKTKLINKKDIVKNLIKYYIKKYDYILIDIGKDSDEFVKEEILKNSDKRIIVGNNNLLKIKEVRKLAKDNKKIEKYSNNKKIIAIQNKVSIYSFSFLINKYILKKSANIYKIFNNKNYIDLLKKILEGKKLKINKLMKIKIKNIIKL